MESPIDVSYMERKNRVPKFRGAIPEKYYDSQFAGDSIVSVDSPTSLTKMTDS